MKPRIVAWVAPSLVAVVVVASAALLSAARRFAPDGDRIGPVRPFFTSNTFVTVTFVVWAASRFVGRPGVGLSLLVGVVVELAFPATWTARPRLRGIPTAPGFERCLTGRLDRAFDRPPTVRTGVTSEPSGTTLISMFICELIEPLDGSWLALTH